MKQKFVITVELDSDVARGGDAEWRLTEAIVRAQTQKFLDHHNVADGLVCSGQGRYRVADVAEVRQDTDVSDKIASVLRADVSQGVRISEALRRCAVQHGLHTIQLIIYLRRAFGLSLSQVAPVGGWRPDGSGEITDAKLDQLLGEAIGGPETGGQP